MKDMNTNFVELVKLLNDGDYHDGTSIGEKLAISRAAVWKLIKKLQQYGIALSSVKGKGYRLHAPLSLLDANAIYKKLRHKSVDVHVVEKTTTTSKQVYSFERKANKITACLAETQTNGRGRFERYWHSPFAENIHLSLLCPFEKDISELSGLSLVTTLAVCHSLEKLFDFSEHTLSAKWPNDVLLDDAKLGGILVEIQAESNGHCLVNIGIGVNVNMQKALKKHIGQKWASLYQVKQQYIERSTLAAEIIDSLIDYFERFCTKGFANFKQEWQKKDYLLNAPVTVTQANKTFKGTCFGINKQGHLKLRMSDGEERCFSSGDTHLMK